MNNDKSDNSKPSNPDRETGKGLAWEEWQLTAFALGELDGELAAEIEQAAADDAQLSSEIAAIGATLNQVSQLYQAEPQQEGLGQGCFSQIVQQAASGTGNSSEHSVASVARNPRRHVWIGVLGMAASLLVAVIYAAPVIRTAMMGSPHSVALNQEKLIKAFDAREQGLVDETRGTNNAEQSNISGKEETRSSRSNATEINAVVDPGGSIQHAVDLDALAMANDDFASDFSKPDSNLAVLPGDSSGDSLPAPLPLGIDASGNSSLAMGSGGYGGGAGMGDDGLGGYGGGYGGEGGGMGGYGDKGGGRMGMGGGGYGGQGGMGGYGGGYGGEGGYGGLGAGGGYGGEGGYGGMSGGGMGGYGGEGGGYGGPGTSNLAEQQGQQSGSQQAGDSKSLAKNSAALSNPQPSSGRQSVAQQQGSQQPSPQQLARGGWYYKTPASPYYPYGDVESGNTEAIVTGTTVTRELHVTNSRRRNHVFERELESKLRRGSRARREYAGDRFSEIYENQFARVEKAPLSTLSIDVDTASYTKSRQLLLENRSLPPAGAVRLEEFINYFDYEYAGPQGEDPFASDLAVADCPWRPEHQLVRIALRAKKMEVQERPKANIVFLLDVSGSMDKPNKLPLVKESMRMLISQLGENDKVAMAVYAGAAGCVLEGTSGDQQKEILSALENLNAGGSTNGGQGIQLAYNLARDNFVPGGINRVILCTDGDFNVGLTSTQSLVDMVAENAKSKIFLTVLGYGMGNTNDAMMEEISNRGDGVYGFVDSRHEAHRQMVKQLAGNLVTVAKDVKIQVEFNPNTVASYRLLGYENRVMAAEDFNNDKKDAGEIGAGHRVTALYEIVPVGVESDAGRPPVDDLKYQRPVASAESVDSKDVEVGEEAGDAKEFADELLTLKLRYKKPEGDTSKLLEFPLESGSKEFVEADRDFRWAASMAQFAMLLRDSRYSGNSTWSGLIQQATSAAGISPDASRQECLEMMRTASRLMQ